MDISLFLAKFLGLYMLIIAIIWITRKNKFDEGVHSIVSSDGTFYLASAINILVGLLIVIAHPIWKLNWQVIITILGYFSILQGILRLSFPRRAQKIILASIKTAGEFWIVFLLAVGGILTYYGFFSAQLN